MTASRDHRKEQASRLRILLYAGLAAGLLAIAGGITGTSVLISLGAGSLICVLIILLGAPVAPTNDVVSFESARLGRLTER